MSSSIPYDPLTPEAAAAGTSQNSKIQSIKKNLDSTVEEMRQNILRMDQRGQNLDVIESKADDLERNARNFQTQSSSVRKRMWRKDMKMRMCLILGVVIILLVIIIPIATHFTKK